MGVFEAHGLRVPDDISVVGYDDSQIARLDLVQLTSVRQARRPVRRRPRSSSWSTASTTPTPRVVERIETTLVERRTTCPPAQSSVNAARNRSSA